MLLKSCMIGADILYSFVKNLLLHHSLNLSDCVCTLVFERVCSFEFRYTDLASLTKFSKTSSKSLFQYTVRTPDVSKAFSLLNFSPSQIAISLLVSFKNKISLCLGFEHSGKMISILSSWSTPLNQNKSLFCLNGMVPSAFVGILSFEQKIASDFGFICAVNWALLYSNNFLDMCWYFIKLNFVVKIYTYTLIFRIILNLTYLLRYQLFLSNLGVKFVLNYKY